MLSKLVFCCALVSTAAAYAQTATDFSPPPMVPAGPPPPPAPEPGSQLIQPGTPPPPSTVPPPGYVPGQPQSGYQYSPYGNPQPLKDEKAPVEWGLMVSESLFGMLTSAGVSLIPYFLLLRPMVTGQGATIGDPTVSTVIFVLIFSAVPLAVSQTQLSLANGSRHYFSESWPAALAGLGAQAAVLGLFFLLPRSVVTDVSPMAGRSEGLLLVGSIAFVPLVQMLVINLTKSPRVGRMAAVSRDEQGKLSLGLPTVAPLIGQTRAGMAVGLQAQMINLRF